jgi:putative ABC transport system permease protein
MRLDQLVLRNISQHRLGSALTMLNVALGAFLVVVILLLRSATAGTFLAPSRGFSLVVGAPGSGLQLVLNTVFHIGQSPGLLAHETFEELEQHASTELAVPYAVGDAFRGFPVVGTTEAFFHPRFPFPAAATSSAKFLIGRPFRFDRPALRAALAELTQRATAQDSDTSPSQVEPALGSAGSAGAPVQEAVLGADVAAALDIRVGDRIEPSHGVGALGTAHHVQRLWDVVGILRPTATPIDKLVLINLDSFFRIEDHQAGVIPESGKPAISSVVLFPKPGVHKALLLSQLNKRTQLQVADVDSEVRQLLNIIGNVDQIFFVIAQLVVLAAAASVTVAIYNTLAARRRELAILRILGARRETIFGLVVGEAALLSAIGAAIGLGVAHLLVWITASWVEGRAGVRPSAAVFLPEEALAYVFVVMAGALGGLLPASKAYRTDAAAHLSPLA